MKWLSHWWCMKTIRFRTNARKALEAILWCARRKGEPIDFHTVLKVLFGADVRHLNEYGRPVVGDAYKALPYGPVGQTAYDIMKREPLALSVLNLERLPFDVIKGHFICPTREPDMSVFSRSDIEALEAGWMEYGIFDFDTRTQRSHSHKAYRNALDVGKLCMDYADFLEDDPDGEKVRDLLEIAEDLRL